MEHEPVDASRDRCARSPRQRGWLLPGLILGAALICNPTTIGAGYAVNEFIYNELYVVVIRVAQGIGVVAGGLLFVPAVRRRWPRGLWWPSLGVAVILIGIGGYGFARWKEWIRPRVKSLQEGCAWVGHGRDPFLGTALRNHFEGLFLKSSPQDEQWARWAFEYGTCLLNTGEVEQALAVLESALQIGRDQGRSEAELVRLRRALGTAWLRRGELDNCVAAHGPESCLYPLSGGGVWKVADCARSAATLFAENLRIDPEDLVSRWLLNLAHMAMGSWPSGLPAELRIEPTPPNAGTEIPIFRNAAPAMGLATVDLMGGVILEDFDNDGNLDIVTSSYHPCEPMRFYRNLGDGRFEDQSKATGIANQTGGFNLIQGDYDNDGRTDLYVIRGAWMRAFGRQRNSLLRQCADGTFEDVTEAAGLADDAYPNAAAAFADVDQDGHLDLFVGNERIAPNKTVPTLLYRNQGDGTFRNITSESGIDANGDVKSVAFGDYDCDGDQDLYISIMDGPNHLYRNLGDGRFEDRATALGVAHHPPLDRTFGSWFFDYDQDGYLDLYVAGYGALEFESLVADRLGQPSAVERLTLYRNTGDGTFVDVTREVGLYQVHMPMGANFGDLTNDGYPDIYLGTGFPGLDYLVPNVLFLNEGGSRFVDVTVPSRTGHLQKGHAVAFGDLDNDGDIDIFAHMGGFYVADRSANACFENPGSPRNSVSLRLVGTKSNRSALGTRVCLTVSEGGQPRRIYGRVGQSGGFGASSLRLELGVGRADRIKKLEIDWCGSGHHQVIENLPINVNIAVTEFEESAVVNPRRPFRLP